jgi:hypothetical protein
MTDEILQKDCLEREIKNDENYNKRIKELK